MRLGSPKAVITLLLCATGASAGTPAQTAPPELLKSIPLRFEPQDAAQKLWTARGQGFAVYLDGPSTILRSGNKIVRLTLDGSDPEARMAGLDPAVRSCAGRSWHRQRRNPKRSIKAS